MNFIVLSGFVSSEPKVAFIKTGAKVVSFNLCVRDDRKASNGEYPQYYFRITAWGASADFAEKYIQHHNFINVVGKLVQDKYKDKITGKTQYTVHIIADHLENRGNDTASKSVKNASGQGQSIGNGLLDYVDNPTLDESNLDSMFT